MNENNYWMMQEMGRMYREDRLREAAEHRLAAAAVENESETVSLVAQLLFGLGQRMARWGLRLEDRYRCAAGLSTYPASDC